MFEDEGFTDIEKAAFERSLSAPPQGYSFQQPNADGTFGNKDIFNARLNPRLPQQARSTTDSGFDGNEFGNRFLFDEDNLEKFDLLENSRLNSLLIDESNDIRSALDLIQEDFPSTPSAIFGHKGLTGDDNQSQKSTSSGPSSPLREKSSLNSSSNVPTDKESSPEVKDELADVLVDIDQSMSGLYVAEESSSEGVSTESPSKQNSSSGPRNFPQQFPNGQPNGQSFGYTYEQNQQGENQGQGLLLHPSDYGFQQPIVTFAPQFPGQNQVHQQGQMMQHVLQQQQQAGLSGMGAGMHPYNIPSRGQMATTQHVSYQQGLGVIDLGNGQTAMVNPGMAMGIDQQVGGYYVNVMPNGTQQPIFVDPFYQGRMNMANNGHFPQIQSEIAYSNANTGNDGINVNMLQYVQPPNSVGSYWVDPNQIPQQNPIMMHPRGQQGHGGIYLPQDQQQYNGVMGHLNQQQMNMIPRGIVMPAHIPGANGGYPMQQNVQNPFINGPLGPAGMNSQPPPSPSKGGQNDMQDGYRQDGNSGDKLDENSGNSSYNDRRGYSAGGRSNASASHSNNGHTSPTMTTMNRGAANAGSGAGVARDPVVEDFRNTYGKGRQWEIRDLVGHVVAFCQDQHGSRFIQQRLEVASDPDKQLVFDEVLPSAHSLMTDVFGNYVIQKLFEFGTPEQCETLAALLMGQAVPLALQMYGCRVIQKALEYVATPRLVALVGEFEGQQVLRCVHDQNGNHVIQKCIEVVSRVAKEAQPDLTEYLSSRIQFIIQAFSGRVRELSMHPYGCRVVQRILEHCTNTQKAPVLDELRKCCRELIQDQYGNYVIQHVMQHGWETDKAILIEEVQSRLLEYSQHKFASNVVEKCIQYADKKDRDKMIWTIINVTFDLNNPVDAKTGQCVLENMVRDPYANYVVQKVIDVSDTAQRGAIIRYMRENIVQLRRYTYGKHIIIRLEKVSGEKF